VLRLLAGSAVAAALGAISGSAILASVALLAPQVFGAPVPWEGSAGFQAVSLGSAFGVPLGVAAYVLFFSPFPPLAVARQVPLLFLFALLGAIPIIWLGYGVLVTVVPAFLAGCAYTAHRLARQTGIEAHPFR
jgi:hypothetical protein